MILEGVGGGSKDKKLKTYKKIKKLFLLIMVAIRLDPWQRRFIETKGDKILCCGRQIGKSEVCSIDAVEYAVSNPGTKPIVMIAPTERQAFGLFSKTLQYLSEKYPSLIMKKKDRPTQTRIRLKVSGKMVEIYCLPVGATGLGVRFLSIGRLYVDEASRLPELVWEAVTPALWGDMVVLSTPAGCVGRFYEIWINKNGAYDSFTRFDPDNPLTSEKVIAEREVCFSWTKEQREQKLRLIEQEKKRMSNRQFAQEYMGEFVEELHRWFSEELINKTCTLKRPETFKKDANYFLGVDIARMGEDSSSFEIFMRTSDMIVQVDSIVKTKQLTTQTEDTIRSLDRKYNFRRIYIDAGAGSLGVSVFDHLIQDPSMRKRVKAINNAERIIDYNPGGEPSRVKLKKEDLYDNLRALMEQGRIKLLDDEDIIFELSSVQYEYVIREGYPSRLKIFAHPSPDIVEGIIRGAWCVKEKINKLDILYI